MLTHIHIKNFTIVSSLALDFQKGFCVLTGETGAGKSIWIDAVALALGARADSNVIRHGENSCDITLCFDITKHLTIKNWLCQHGLEAEEECYIRRRIQREGPSRSTINGTPCPQNLIRELGELLLNIHGQHQNQTLLKREQQRYKLDEYANSQKLLTQVKKYYQQCYDIEKQLDQLKAQAQNRDQELQLLRYQYNELAELALQENEWKALSQKHQQLHNAKDLIQKLNQAIHYTSDNESANALYLLQQAITELNISNSENPHFNNAKNLLNTAAIHLQEASDELHHYRNQLDLSPEILTEIENRLSLIHDLARKHQVRPAQLPDITITLKEKITALENIETHIKDLEIQQKNALFDYNQSAEKLTKNRQKAIITLNPAITKSIRTLGIEGSQFEIQLEKNTEAISPYGNEQVQFMISTNPGQPLQPMQKIVSGGELSRISLALQVLMNTKNTTPTLIFDEVDVGIGGKTAETVGKLLRTLGEKVQVLCITHLAQVAAQGHHHFKVSKITKANKTNSQISLLNSTERRDEIARMLGGSKITEQTLAHADEMLETN